MFQRVFKKITERKDFAMKITTFNSFIATSRTDETIRLFEELGFERRHKKEGNRNSQEG